MGKRNSCHPVTVEWLGHFQVSPSLCFKARLSAKQVIWKSFLVWWRWTSLSQKGFALSLVLKVTVFGTWKRPIEQWAHDEPHFGIPVEQNNSGSVRRSWSIIVHFQDLSQNITIHDSSAYNNLRQRVITIYDSLVITIRDNCYYNLRQILQFTTTIITIHDRTNSK